MSEATKPNYAKGPTITAERIEHVTKIHDTELKDYYFYLREKTSENVLNYIKSENEYCDAQFAPLKDLQQELYQEFLSRIKQSDET